MSGIANAVTGFLGDVLTFLHDLVARVGFLEAAAWGWAIILLTIIVRVALLPLAIKQTRSMRAMTALQPQMKAIQKKHKVDRELMKKDPEQYRAKKQKLNEEMMALYQREGVNPAASCLPLLAQAPVFLALFWTLQRFDPLIGAEFYFFTAVGEGGLEQLVSQAGWPGWLLIVLMSGTMFISQKQMMARNASQMADNPMAQQQKILLYVMPVFLAVISFNFPMGILLYWVTTNFWQVAQQWIILREVQQELETGEIADHPGGEAAKGTIAPPQKGERKRSPGASSGQKKRPETGSTGGKGPEKAGGNGSSGGAKRGGGAGDAGSTEGGGGAKGSRGAKGSGSKDGGAGDVGRGSAAEDRPTTNGRANGAPARGDQGSKPARQGSRDHLPRRRGGGEKNPGGSR